MLVPDAQDKPGGPPLPLAMKAILDKLGALAGLALFSPILLLAAIAVRWSLGSPVLFRQMRPGLRGEPFRLFKFRTMRTGEGTDEQRLTRAGRVLRRWSLDELPELLNVFRGDMSLVGPRPLLTQYLPRYTARQARRHQVKPGVTGWAQVNGRNAIGWEQKLDLDVWYVDNWSLWLDLRILSRTLAQVLSRRGIGHAGAPTMPEFLGGGESPSQPPRAAE